MLAYRSAKGSWLIAELRSVDQRFVSTSAGSNPQAAQHTHLSDKEMLLTTGKVDQLTLRPLLHYTPDRTTGCGEERYPPSGEGGHRMPLPVLNYLRAHRGTQGYTGVHRGT